METTMSWESGRKNQEPMKQVPPVPSKDQNKLT